MPLDTRLTRSFGIAHPVVCAPMAFAAGGALAAAISDAGGLGLIGGGYGDRDWIDREFEKAGNAQVGCGFIAWSLAQQEGLLESVLDRRPAALFLSFGDFASPARKAREAGVPVICQIQTVEDARRAIDCGATVIAAQGSEAGGHGEKRATMALVPEVADLLAARAPDILLCAAGGIADGRGIAASLMLGADGVVVGSRFWASREALVPKGFHTAALEADGDDTIRSSVMDIVRSRAWPARFTARVLKNGFTRRWHDHEDELRAHAAELAPLWAAAWQSGDAEVANTFVGEVVGQIDRIEPAALLLDRMIEEAELLLGTAGRYVRKS